MNTEAEIRQAVEDYNQGKFDFWPTDKMISAGVTQDNLEQEIARATTSLLVLAKEATWNVYPGSCAYILSTIQDFQDNFAEENKRKKGRNEKKTPRLLEEVVKELEVIYADLYDINLYIYKTNRWRTIIEIQYYMKSQLKEVYRHKVMQNAPMLHAKIPLPLYATKKEEKFDIHWSNGTLLHSWKLFKWIQNSNRRLVIEEGLRELQKKRELQNLIQLRDQDGNFI